MGQEKQIRNEQKKHTDQDLNNSWMIGYNTGEKDGRIRAMKATIEFLEEEIKKLKNSS